MANDSIQKMKTLVLERLTSDLEASDCLVCLFWSALSSYRYDTVLRPFPQMFTLEDGRKDIDGLRAVFETFTDLLSIKQNIDNLNVTSLTFLHWILCTRSFKVTTLPVSEFDVISKLTPHSTHNVEPYKIFKVVHSVEQERKWSELAKDFETFLAYHGSRFENFHSIIHNGLLSHMNKISLYGEGTYLSTDLSVCMNFSPSALSWPRSMLPSLCSMVAVCEVIKHPDIKSRIQYGGEPSLTQKIPEQYFVVTNNEYLRVKYVLAFTQERRRQHKPNWLSGNKWLLFITSYIVVLIIIGVWQSKFVSQLFYQYSKKQLSF